MPNSKAAAKRVRVNAAKSQRNKAVRSDLRTAIKKAELALTEGSEDKVQVVRFAMSKIDRAVSKGILHKNNAARKKSQLSSRLNKV